MNYTRDDMEVACCLWEAMLELRDKIPTPVRGLVDRSVTERQAPSDSITPHRRAASPATTARHPERTR